VKKAIDLAIVVFGNAVALNHAEIASQHVGRRGFEFCEMIESKRGTVLEGFQFEEA
jgi:hypothetical protein